MSEKTKTKTLVVPKQKYMFPLYGATIEAESLEDAEKQLKQKLKGKVND